MARFGQAMLAGSGGTVAAHFTPSLIVIGAAAGIVCGILAIIGPAVRLVREGPLASMASVGGVQRAATGDVLRVHQGAARRQYRRLSRQSCPRSAEPTFLPPVG